MSNTTRKSRLKTSGVYQFMQRVTVWLDRYYLDAIAGLIPGGIGDAAAALFSLVHVYFSLFRLHSIPLTLAILNNVLRDILLGLIPFYVGNVIDFFHRANSRNMVLIDGFINDDEVLIKEVNRKAAQAAAVLVTSFIAILLMLALLVKIAQVIGTALFT
ncbi:MAG: DUF4112 domain-containing protein [Prevotella sp.]|nr:DUF4112 domain-containing protein [Prevotella sp.]